MKKILLASTAVVLSAGVAAADVRLSGDGRMGIIYDNGIAAAAGANNTARFQFTSRARVTFTMSGETDGGLAFGASFRADNAGNGTQASGNTAMTGGNVFIRGEFGRIQFGDVAGAARAAVGDLYAVGLTDLADLHNMGYLDRSFSVGAATGLNRRTSVLYDYTIDAFTIFASVGQQRRTEGGAPNAAMVAAGAVAGLDANNRLTDDMAAIGVRYTFDGLTVAAGYEMARQRLRNAVVAANNVSFSANHLIASVEYSMDDFRVKGIVGRAGGDLGNTLSTDPGARRTQYGLAASGTFDATTVSAFVNRKFEGRTDYGIGAAYDLGGGARLMGGISREGSQNTVGSAFNQQSRTRADLGLAFTF